ncbi:MAG TPA: deoxynucleoside kinase [Anaeromyxobacteraceae bacterium]|nr:deoxynucleoside kinase [Anaeromyxobacteraceae bacterium]
MVARWTLRGHAWQAPRPRLERARYIAIEGPMGAGKTALAQLLVERMGGRLVADPVDANPFLPAFHEDRRKHAFQAQVFALLARWQQQQGLYQQDLFGQVTVADYLFAKDRIFATLNLSPEEHSLYEAIHALVGARTVKPDLVVYLQARREVLLARLRRRPRAHERHVDPDYLAAVAQAYNEFFFHYEATPLLVVNTSDVDLAASPVEADALVAEIRRHRKGTAHYNPTGR